VYGPVLGASNFLRCLPGFLALVVGGCVGDEAGAGAGAGAGVELGVGLYVVQWVKLLALDGMGGVGV
jgi:hypothetical protein